MLPIVLDVGTLRIVLVAEGEAGLRRLELLDAAGAAHVDVFTGPTEGELVSRAGARRKGARPSREALEGAGLVLIAGLGEAETEELANVARQAGRLVNAEDRKPLCDFHIPSIVRRGDLLLTVSTGGQSPGLARRIRRYLEGLFGPEWSGRLKELAERRETWREEGLEPSEVGRRSEAYVENRGWLP